MVSTHAGKPVSTHRSGSHGTGKKARIARRSAGSEGKPRSRGSMAASAASRSSWKRGAVTGTRPACHHWRPPGKHAGVSPSAKAAGPSDAPRTKLKPCLRSVAALAADRGSTSTTTRHPPGSASAPLTSGSARANVSHDKARCDDAPESHSSSESPRTGVEGSSGSNHRAPSPSTHCWPKAPCRE